MKWIGCCRYANPIHFAISRADCHFGAKKAFKMANCFSAEEKRKPLITLEKPALSRVLEVVEMGGIEPPSESACSRLSPGAVGYLTAGGCPFPSRSKPTRLPGRVASLCMVRSKLCARTDAADRRPGPGPQRSRAGRACLKRRPERSCRSQLLFKVPVFKDGRGIRPLIAHPHPRRNHCIPGAESDLCHLDFFGSG